MINWDNFYVFAAVSICLWLAGAVFALRSSSKNKVAIGFTSGGIIILGIFIAGLWIFLQRPPLRTMGETRLWYSFFMGIAGLLPISDGSIAGFSLSRRYFLQFL